MHSVKSCIPRAVKKRLWRKCFPVNLAKCLRTPFLQNTSGRLLLFLAFQNQPPELLYEKKCSWKFPKIHSKTPLVCEIFKNIFFTECLVTGRLPLLLAFEKQPLELFYEKRCSWKSRKIYRKTDTFGLQNFLKHLFYRTPLDDCFWLFRATLLKWGTANNVWKTSDEYSLSRNTNLRSTAQIYRFFFR